MAGAIYVEEDEVEAEELLLEADFKEGICVAVAVVADNGGTNRGAAICIRGGESKGSVMLFFAKISKEYLCLFFSLRL